MSNEKVEIEWVDIPNGIFAMGSPLNEPERGWQGRWVRYPLPPSEEPPVSLNETKHMVTINKFKLSKYAITFNQYDKFCQLMGFDLPDDNGWGRGNRPVINVSWNDANNFAIWLGCRLPTESEWEYSCRAGTITPFNTGSNITIEQANFDAEFPYNGNNASIPYGQTLPVGSFPSNEWGLYDMHGNVWEWCSDWHGPYSNSAQVNPSGPLHGEGRVVRGGSWNSDACKCRSAVRNFYMENDILNTIGFRIARD